MKAMILARKFKTRGAQTAATAAGDTPEGVIPEVVDATPAEVILEEEVATLAAATLAAVEDPVGDKMMAGGTRRITKRYRS